jgi:hypothetical protein
MVFQTFSQSKNKEFCHVEYASIFRVEEWGKQETRIKAGGTDMFLWNFGQLSVDCTVLYPRR